eukprot:3241186-Amphidinium_carterae.1
MEDVSRPLPTTLAQGEPPYDSGRNVRVTKQQFIFNSDTKTIPTDIYRVSGRYKAKEITPVASIGRFEELSGLDPSEHSGSAHFARRSEGHSATNAPTRTLLHV